MSYSVIPLRPFEKQLKRLAGKYPSLKEEFAALVEALSEDPSIGTSLGNGSFKI